MTTLNATHFDDPRLCSIYCNSTSIAVYDYKGCTNCDPSKRMVALHGNETCHEPPALLTGPTPMIPLETPRVEFTQTSGDV